jgi:hypothetical protein
MDDERTPPAPGAEIALPPADPSERRAVTQSPALTALREIQIEQPPPESLPERARAVEARANGPLKTEIRTHELTLERSTVQHEVEPAQPPTAPALAAPRLSTVHVPVASRDREPRRQDPRIEVRIGRVEVRRTSPPEPIEWQAPAATPPAVTSFGALAASRRYVDRRWS